MSIGSMMFTRFKSSNSSNSYTPGLWRVKPENGIYYRLFNGSIQASTDGVNQSGADITNGCIEAYLYATVDNYMFVLYSGNYPYFVPLVPGGAGGYYAATDSQYQDYKSRPTTIKL